MIDYIVQGVLSGIILHEETHSEEAVALARAVALADDATFEGTDVRVITSDGELVFESEPFSA